MTTQETAKKGRNKKSDSTESTNTNVRKTITMTEQEASELKILSETLQISESELIKIAIKAITVNANKIHQAQEKTAYKPEMIVVDGVTRFCNQLIEQKNIGSKNSELAQAYDIIKSGQAGKYRSIVSKLATSVGTNYNTAETWLKLNHPEELNK